MTLISKGCIKSYFGDEIRKHADWMKLMKICSLNVRKQSEQLLKIMCLPDELQASLGEVGVD